MSRGRGARGRGDSHRVRAGGSLLANLAAQPFVNKRPVQRFAMAAWAVTALLVGINVALWVNYRHQSTSLRDKIAAARADIDAKSRSVVKMDEELRGLRIGAQNAQVAFLNARIAERTFPWSLLFERIADTLPDGVRLLSLNPVFSDDDKKQRSGDKERRATAAETKPGEELINLKLQGAAKSAESLYQLIDAFFASPAFASPRLYQENSNGVDVGFTVDVDYRPRYQPESSHRPAVAGENEAAETTDRDAAGAAAASAAAASDDDTGGDPRSAARSTVAARPHGVAPAKAEDDLVKRLEASHPEPRRRTPVATDEDTGAEVDE